MGGKSSMVRPNARPSRCVVHRLNASLLSAGPHDCANRADGSDRQLRSALLPHGTRYHLLTPGPLMPSVPASSVKLGVHDAIYTCVLRWRPPWGASLTHRYFLRAVGWALRTTSCTDGRRSWSRSRRRATSCAAVVPPSDGLPLKLMRRLALRPMHQSPGHRLLTRHPR
jgi:hypothetical protein